MDSMSRSRELCTYDGSISRRKFGLHAGMGLAGLALACGRGISQDEVPSPVALARNADRKSAFRGATNLLGRMDFGGRDVLLKANYNSLDPFPATTHPDTLTGVISYLRESNCGAITLVERSGMGVTHDIWVSSGVSELAGKLGFALLALEDLTSGQWRKEGLPGSNWKAGIEVPQLLNRDAYVIQICNLKTHRFGGIFSGSLKNSIGLMAKYGHVNAGYNYMAELHSSAQQGAMIAEVNLAYEPKLVIMDAMQVFTSGGPEAGEVATPEVFFASGDRVAIDAAGVALLRLQRDAADQPLNLRAVYEQDQIRRASELHLGARSMDEIRFLTEDARSSILASQLESLIREVPKTKK
jgi:uncharacterized protein (DUF362 family)